MKNNKPVIIVLGEPNSIFVEILSKVIGKKSIQKIVKYPLIIIGSKNLILSQLKILNRSINFENLNKQHIDFKKLKNKIYLIDIHYKFKKPFEPISKSSKNYINQCFEKGFEILNKKISNILINGPISKKHFLENKHPGVTEYIFDNSKKKISKNPVMLIYNQKFSVSPITTHIPLKNVYKKLNQKTIINNALTINRFYKNKLKIKPKIAIIGLNPHCETKTKLNEELKIIIPALKKLKKRNINVYGPFAADTFFLRNNLSHYNSIIGMYHDQVLTPFKTIFGFDASNITLGLPFLRLSVDHGPNVPMLGKNKSDTKSLENIFKFINSIE